MSSINLSNKEIFERIKYFLKKQGLTAFELSLQLGHEKSYLSRLERGVMDLSFSTFFAILDILNVNTFEFFYPNLERFEDDLSFLDLLNSLPEEEKMKVYRNLYLKVHTN